MWRWAAALKPGIRPESLVVILSRGGGKSTTVQLIVAWIGQSVRRRYALYVSSTQDQADKHVSAIAPKLDKLGIGRALNKYGNSKGWRRNILRASNGFNVEALGLDTAARGIKLADELGDHRPDLIILDDIDTERDTPNATAKKVESLRSAIIPAGSTDCAVIAVQNMVLDGGVFSQLADGSADFLRRRMPALVVPAVVGLEYEPYQDGERTLYRITGGTAAWEGQDLATCELQMNDWGLAAFLREAQHEVTGADGYFFDHKAFRTEEKLPGNLSGWRWCRAWDLAATQGGGDYTAGPMHGWSPQGVEYVTDLKHDQLSSDRVRKLIIGTAIEDVRVYGPHTVRIPDDPGQAGTYQSEQIAAELRKIPGVKVSVVAPTGRKGVRARGWADQVNNGNVVLIKGPWNHALKEEHRKFREDEQHEHDDIVDADSDAHNELAPKKAPQRPAFGIPRY